MEPVVTPAEMAAVDDEAPEGLDELIARAAGAVARAAVGMLGRRYGARVLVIAGKGNNGADGRVAARLLERQGLRCAVVEATGSVPPALVARADLVVDAAYGTGFRGAYTAPAVGGTPILAVDIPSGVDGLTGAAADGAVRADATVTFAARKPGLLLAPGRWRTGPVTVADIGLRTLVEQRARAWLLDRTDVADAWPRRGVDAHKWRHAVWVVGGHATMVGAPALAVAAALRAGAGYGAVSVPGLAAAGPPLPVEAVVRPVPEVGWAAAVSEGADRFGALVVGPGLLPTEAALTAVQDVVVATRDRPLVLDGGALDAVAAAPAVLAERTVPAVLTPHDGELARLLGRAPGVDRPAEARAAAARLRAVILLKGPTTVVAHPDGRVLLSAAGDERLATAGSGDVLAGIIGAGLALGLDPFRAAGLGAELHGAAAGLGRRRGLVAGDLPDLVARYRSGPG